nr:RNA-directed DNA polymerase, eukaryota [Tanacetum cinerariifolium]
GTTEREAWLWHRRLGHPSEIFRSDNGGTVFSIQRNSPSNLLSIRGIFANGDWLTDPKAVKDTFRDHFAARFKLPTSSRLKLNMQFSKRLSNHQVEVLDSGVTRAEIREAVWGCGVNKSPSPDGYTFEFFRRYWNIIGPNFCDVVEGFFDDGFFPKGNNASFITLIPKVIEAKFVTDFRPISLIGSVYKVVTKILANRLATVISGLVSDSQSAFIANRQILDGPFILNEVLAWCKRKKKQALIFKADFAKAYDSVRWDFLLDVLQAFGFVLAWCKRKKKQALIFKADFAKAYDSVRCWDFLLDVLQAFGFGLYWCKWIRGIFTSAMASVLINGSPTSEFPFFCGLKQGLQLHESVAISHLFYADNAVFIGEWFEGNLENLVRILNCFYLATGLKINLQKSHVLGVKVPYEDVKHGASLIGFDVMRTPFKYLGVTVGDFMSRNSAWVNVIQKIQSWLSKWKSKTLSVGGRLTLVKSVLGAAPLYYMSIYKVPKGVLHELESIRSKFFNGIDPLERKITWIAWEKFLASKKNGGLGVSSLFALNRALLLKWVWHFLSNDGSLWSQVIKAIYGKWAASGFNASFRRDIRDGVEHQQWTDMLSILGTVILSPSFDHWICDLNGDDEDKWLLRLYHYNQEHFTPWNSNNQVTYTTHYDSSKLIWVLSTYIVIRLDATENTKWTVLALDQNVILWCSCSYWWRGKQGSEIRSSGGAVMLIA